MSARRQRRQMQRTIHTLNDLGAAASIEEELIVRFAFEPERYYRRFMIPKKDGGLRPIEPPSQALRQIQRRLLHEFYARVQIPTFLHGGIPKRSPLTFAREHVGNQMVATLDVRRFYQSTTEEMVEPVLWRMGFRDRALELLMRLVMLRGALPQGAVTSCLLANLSLLAGDHDFLKLCKRWSLTFGRFVDDIAISGNSDFRALEGPFRRIIERSGYFVADEKVVFRSRSERQVIVGLTVNDRLSPTKDYISTLTSEVRTCLDLGSSLLADEQGVSVQRLKAQLTGRIRHVGQTRPEVARDLRGIMCDIKWKCGSPKREHCMQ